MINGYKLCMHDVRIVKNAPCLINKLSAFEELTHISVLYVIMK